MPEPFKNAFNPQLILGMAGHFQNQWSEFDRQGFSDVASRNLDTLEVMLNGVSVGTADFQLLMPSDMSL